MKNIFAKSAPEWTLLNEHLLHVAMAATTFAYYLGFDQTFAYNGAILHDIGKAHPFFQDRLFGKTNRQNIFRHEIASLLFLSVFPKEQWPLLIEMVVGHHKSVKKDPGGMGLLDLEENDDYQEFHLGEWEEWSVNAVQILNGLGINCSPFSRAQAIQNLSYCITYCEKEVKIRSYSKWRGLLMGADHFASSMNHKTEQQTKRIFKNPDLSFYDRQHLLYPLSFKDASSPKRHTIVVASTGSGKTDYLFRRCRNRVFYTLPFQASINAMYKRIGNDLESNNSDIDIRVLHSTSIIVKRKEDEETALQNLMGSSIKILTPHQLAGLIFGMKGYESLILDIQGCDVVLDEVHTYSGISQALVLKIVEVLKSIACRIHIGTATMPTILYDKIKELLGDDLLEINLNDEELDKFDRHIVHKVVTFGDTEDIIRKTIENDQKLLIVLNTVKASQEVFKYINDIYPDTPSLLLHSRFKRRDRNIKERKLLGLDEDGISVGDFNTSDKACIVVSTQIVEVSLDISFDVMITECAPLDALIQRFGRINRKRTQETIGKCKDVFVIAPPETEKEATPYDLDILKLSYDTLEGGKVLRERDLQDKIDKVFTDINFLSIDEHSVFKSDIGFTLDKLTHNSKAILFELLKIDSAPCILECDREEYENGNFETRLSLEIQAPYGTVVKTEQLKMGHKPFIVPEAAYDFSTGLDTSKIREEKFNLLNRFL